MDLGYLCRKMGEKPDLFFGEPDFQLLKLSWPRRRDNGICQLKPPDRFEAPAFR